MTGELAVIGAGWCRTGTHALAIALTRLGFGPCQHMTDLAADRDLARAWQGVLAGDRPIGDVYDG